MNLSQFVKWFGIVLLAVGALGFVPGVTADGRLLGVFEVDALHNVIHLLTGALALVFAAKSPKTFLQVFGVVYLLVAVLGLVQGGDILGLMTVNGADNVLHIVIAALALYYGFKK